MDVKTFGTQKEAKIVEISPMQPMVLHYDVDYDTTKPEATIKNFVANIRNMLSRYEGNTVRLLAIEEELQDIYHYMEISSNKKVSDGYKIYRDLRNLRRERRICKNENDLLQPIYDYFHATEVLNKLSWVQGECSRAKTVIDGRLYAVKTDILNEWFEPNEQQNNTEGTFDEDILDDNPADETQEAPEKNEPKYRRVWKA